MTRQERDGSPRTARSCCTTKSGSSSRVELEGDLRRRGDVVRAQGGRERFEAFDDRQHRAAPSSQGLFAQNWRSVRRFQLVVEHMQLI